MKIGYVKTKDQIIKLKIKKKKTYQIKKKKKVIKLR